MQKLIIQGGAKLGGDIEVQGSKNAALPILAACALCDGDITLKNCPRLSDTYAAIRILQSIGCKVSFDNNTACVNPCSLCEYEIPDELMREFRSSINFLGAVLGRAGQCRITYPGGCEIGARPIDMHVKAFREMGVSISEKHGILDCRAKGRLKGAKIPLSFPSVGTTENIILAGVLAEGETIICNAAREPEITDLICFLRSCGAKISGEGTGTIVINGVEKLHGCEYEISPDRIVTATYLACAACAGGNIVVKKCRPREIDSILPVFEQMGCTCSCGKNCVYFGSNKCLKAFDMIRTMVYPGFPTDAQSFVMAALCKAKGTSVIVENIFENRYRHVNGLQRMGADIRTEGKVAIIEGVDRLYGAKAKSPDLRGGAALAAAALGAEGISEITDIHYIDRGYEDFEKALTSLGADIRREQVSI